MFHLPILSPLTFGIITTNQCTAACQDCCFECNPQQHDKLDKKTIESIIDQLADAFPNVRIIVLSGGECFTLGETLFEIVAYISQKGLKTRIVSNGFWATSFKQAYLLLKRLKSAGLSELNLSTGDEHLRWVCLDKIVNAAVACVKNHIPVTINVESSSNKNFTSNDLKSDKRLQKYFSKPNGVHIVNGQWVSKNNKSQGLDTSENAISLMHDNRGRCSAILTSPAFAFDNNMIACCGLSSLSHPYLVMGDVRKNRIIEIYKQSFDDFFKIWLFVEGLYSLLNLIKQEAIPEMKINPNLHICEYCAMLYNNSKYYAILSMIYKRFMPRIISQYIILTKNYPKLQP